MKYLLDTHLLLWALLSPKRLSLKTRKLIADENNVLFFSVISLWEVSIKTAAGRHDFQVNAKTFRRYLLDNGYTELLLNGGHAVAAGDLPLLHRDPFDRILITQATIEDIILLTSDKVVAQYPAPIQLVS
jgi:PIN domain nuclease of toxin-antitoxin system